MTVRDADAAADILHDVCLVMLTDAVKLRDPERYTAYAFTVARRRIHAYRRRRQREAPMDNDTMPDRRIDDGMAPDAAADVALLLALLDRLPERQREALILFEVGDLAVEQIRRVQGGTLSGVKSRLSRARAALQTLIADDVPTTEEQR